MASSKAGCCDSSVEPAGTVKRKCGTNHPMFSGTKFRTYLLLSIGLSLGSWLARSCSPSQEPVSKDLVSALKRQVSDEQVPSNN